MSPHVFAVISEEGQGIIVGKNSNRSPNEVQELLFDTENEEGDVTCTYTTVAADPKTHSLIITRPGGLWGCEMGANDQDVVGLNVELSGSITQGLLPQDILRLVLGRSSTAASAVDLTGSLITNHGPETPCAFLLADKSETWYVEGVGKAWVAEKLAPGAKVLPPAEHIGANFEKSATDLEDLAKEKGWNGEGKLTWNEIFLPNSEDDKRSSTVATLMTKHFGDISGFGVKEMTSVLRDVENGVSRGADHVTPTAASQVSVVRASGPACHWFTATPDPTLSVFKPFIFTPNARISPLTTIPPDGDGKHLLYRLHEQATSSGENKVISLLQEMESNCLNEVNTFMAEQQQNLSEVDDLLKDCVEAEVKFYK